MSLEGHHFPCKIQSPYNKQQIEQIQVLMICRKAKLLKKLFQLHFLHYNIIF